MIDPASDRTVAVQAASASEIEAYPAVREVWVVVLDVTMAAVGQVRAPAAVAAHPAWEAVVAAVAVALEVVAAEVAAVVAEVAVVEGGNE